MSSPNKEPLETTEPQTEGLSPLEKLSRFWKSLTAKRASEGSDEGPHLAFLQRLKKIASPTVTPPEENDQAPKPKDDSTSPAASSQDGEDESITMAVTGVAMKRAFSELSRAFSITARITSRTVSHQVEQIAKSEGVIKLNDSVKKGVASLGEVVRKTTRSFSSPESAETPEKEPTQQPPENVATPEVLDLNEKTEALKQSDRQAQKAAEKTDIEYQPKKRGRPRKTENPAETKAPARKRGRPPKDSTAAEPKAPAKKRGRPPKAATQESAKKTTAPVKKKTETATKSTATKTRKPRTTTKKSEPASQ